MKVEFVLSKNQTHIGHCQLNYYAYNIAGQRLYYCLQDNGAKFGGVRLMRCTKDFEPSHPVTKFLDGITAEFQRPKIEDSDSNYCIELKKLSIDYIEKYEQERTL